MEDSGSPLGAEILLYPTLRETYFVALNKKKSVVCQLHKKNLLILCLEYFVHMYLCSKIVEGLL